MSVVEDLTFGFLNSFESCHLFAYRYASLCVSAAFSMHVTAYRSDSCSYNCTICIVVYNCIGEVITRGINLLDRFDQSIDS